VRELAFSGDKVTPELLRSLEEDAALEKLVIWGGGLTTGDLEPLSRLTQLKSLGLGEMRVDDGVFAWLQPLRRLECLNLAYTAVRGEFSVLAGLPLRDIRLEGCRLVGDSCAMSLTAFPTLRQLEIHMTGVTDAGVETLTGLPLEVLWLGPRITDTALNSIGQMASMQHLDLCAHMVTDEGVPALAGLGNLEVLWLSRCGISDESVQVLAGMQSLRELNVSHTGVSAAALQRLREALPDCRLVEPD
jgi:hypothetical protein